MDRQRSAPTDGANDVEMFDADASGRLTPVATDRMKRGPGLGRGLGVSVPGAVAGVLLVGALAFGAAGFMPADDEAAPDAKPVPARTAPAKDRPSTVPLKPAAAAGEQLPKPDAKPAAEKPSATPTPEPVEKPAPTAVTVERFALAAKAVDGRVVVDWDGCDVDGLAYYKVVRSPDGKVTWPMGENDTLVAAVEDASTTVVKDAKAPAGTQLWYRVFGLAKVDGALVLRCISELAAVTTPATADPTAKPPASTSLALSVALKEGHPYLKWAACESGAFDYYKIVMSKDKTVSWPAGDDDAVVGAIGERDQVAFWHKDAPGGKTLYYRVFCVSKTDAGYAVLASSAVKAVTTPAPEPPPAPYALGFEVAAGEGGVLLDWESCGSDGFVYYKVVRSQSSNPSYLPWTDGSEVIAVIENAGSSAFEDANVASGQTWYYRVQAIGKWNGQKVVLGQTPVLEVAIP